MDADRIDHLARALVRATDRRAVLAVLASALAIVSAPPRDDAEAKRRDPKGKPQERAAACRPRGTRCAGTVDCCDGLICRGGTCTVPASAPVLVAPSEPIFSNGVVSFQLAVCPAGSAVIGCNAHVAQGIGLDWYRLKIGDTSATGCLFLQVGIVNPMVVESQALCLQGATQSTLPPA